MTLTDGNTFNICDGKALINDFDDGGMEIMLTTYLAIKTPS